jgi:hypothetical protein
MNDVPGDATPGDRHGVMAHRPTFIAHKSQRFLIMDAPTDQNMQAYIQVRACRGAGARRCAHARPVRYRTRRNAASMA